jgi:DNA-binding response OmpR family regulator
LGEALEGVQLAGVVGAKVLVVETDESFRRLISERLRLERYKVYEACQQTEARKMVLKKDFDVVLLGFKGDRQLALALLRTIKEMRPLVEVILLSSSEGHSLAASIEGMKLGAFDEILVPFDVETLLRRIQEACRRKWQREHGAKRTLQAQRPND